MKPRIIKIIRDVDFGVIGVIKDGVVTDVTDDNMTIEIENKHGTVIYVAGMVEGNEDYLICMGSEEKHENVEKMTFQIAFYVPFLEFKDAWYKLNGISEEDNE